MPQAIFQVALLIANSVLVAGVVTVGLTIGLNVLNKALFGGGSKPSDGKVTTNDPVGSRERRYGIVHTSGQRSFLESRNGTLGFVITLGTGEEAEVLEHRINDKVVTVSGGTVTDASYHGAVHIYTRPGTDDQTAIGELTAKFPEWTSDHRQRGCPHAAIICDPVKQELFSEVYGGQFPAYTQVRKAAKLYDPRRDSTAVIDRDGAGAPVYGSGSHRLNNRASWAWSDNGALVIADYAAHPDGFGMGYDAVNWASIAREADVCDENVTTVTGETIKRWRIWASYKLVDDERRDVLTNMLKAIDGFCWQDAESKFNLMVGRYAAPSVTITSDHILGCQASIGPPAPKRVSAIKVLYTEATTGYREQESATVGGGGAGADDPSASPQGVPIYFAPHHNQAARLGKLIFAQLGDRWQGTWLFDLVGLNLLGQRFVRLQQPSLRIDAVFKIEGLRLLLGEQPRRIEATLIEVKPEDWDFDSASEEGTPPLTPGTASAPTALAAPTGLTLTAVQISLGGTNGVAIAASWADPGRPDLRHEAQYRPVAGGDWVAINVDNDARTARTGPVDSGTAFTVRVRALTLLGRASDWASATITPSASVAAPTALAATGGTGSASVTFRMPTGATLAYARLYGGASSSFGSAVQVGADIVGGLGEVITRTDTGLTPGTRYYWARSFDAGGNPSPVAGPVTATIS